ncbi:helix-hairpin-helix domain-containing protein [Acinetobacter sp. ANC 5502]
MSADKKTEALKIVEEGLKELESAKGSVAVGVQKLSRAAKLLDEKNYYVWAEIELGNQQYITPLRNLIAKMVEEFSAKNKPIDINTYEYKLLFDDLDKAGINPKFILTNTFIRMKGIPSTGGLDYSIHHVEDQLPYLKKHGNDQTLYLTNVQDRIADVKSKCHKYLTELHDKLKFSGTITSSFDLLKNAVDDKLLDLDPEIAEQLMLAFKSVSSDNKEEWSHALTTCRRLLESLADKLYPASELKIGNRTFKQNQFVNRLWQFMNDSIQSESNRDLAQTHVNFLGSWLEKTNKLTNKGVHDDVSQLEASKAVFHLYLMLADLLEYLGPSATSQTTKPNLANASLDDIEVHLEVNRNIAKEIYKARIKNRGLTLDQLGEVKGVGAKTLARAKEVFEF